MTKVLTLLLLLVAAPANGQTITVRSGDHEGFTRLVLIVPELRNWSLNRAPNGYSLVITNPTPSYNLESVFLRISKDRISRVYAAPDTGDLKLEINCACYAMPFELNNGMLVIDIKDGMPPIGSPFELTAEGGPLLPLLSSQPEKTPATLGSPPLSPLSSAISIASRLKNDLKQAIKIETAEHYTQIRKDLLWRLSKGVSDGAVEPASAFERVPHDPSLKLQNNMRIGSDFGMVTDSILHQSNALTANGQDCVHDQQLNISAWAPRSDSGIIAEIAANTTNLLGEFDRPDPTAVERAVKFYLALGFGVEARLALKAFNLSLPDRAILETLSYIVDLETPPGAIFSGMEECDTSAALWSLLSNPEMPPTKKIAVPAVLRSFSALPLHLRRLLGPGLVSRFIARDDTNSARAIRDSVLRAQGEAGPNVRLMEAELAIAKGDVELADGLLSPLSGGSDIEGLKATAALIQSQAARGNQATKELITTAESLVHEAVGGDNEALISDALAVGYASQNRFAEAFDLIAPTSAEASKIWNYLADHGNDEAIIDWGIIQKAEYPQNLTTETTSEIAKRLLGLGFPHAALSWLAPTLTNDRDKDEKTLLLAAEAELALSKTEQALSRIDGLVSGTATMLRAKILAQMRKEKTLKNLTLPEQPVETTDAQEQAQRWSEISSLDSGGVWRDAVALMNPSTGVITTPVSSVQPVNQVSIGTGPLAQTRATLAESKTARSVLNKLLSN